ncbi:MAG: hypothetical protein VX877_15020, partial [Planctomycetota bacterium]|nr:hypothetical protein [Planctomycetota bacterium]
TTWGKNMDAPFGPGWLMRAVQDAAGGLGISKTAVGIEQAGQGNGPQAGSHLTAEFAAVILSVSEVSH